MLGMSFVRKADTVPAMRAAVLLFGLWGTAERSKQPKA